jgi:hypothetical protein
MLDSLFLNFLAALHLRRFKILVFNMLFGNLITFCKKMFPEEKVLCEANLALEVALLLASKCNLIKFFLKIWY